MLQRNSRPAKVLGALLLGGLSLIMCMVLAWGAWLPFTTGPIGVLPVSGDSITFPPRDPCTPVPDPLNPPVYPNAEHIAVTQSRDHRWLELWYTTSFDTQDDADAVLAYYRDKMVRDGWSLEFELSKDLPQRGLSIYDYVDREVANMADLRDAQGYAAFCNTTSAHPIRVVVVVRTPDSGRTEVQLRVY